MNYLAETVYSIPSVYEVENILQFRITNACSYLYALENVEQSVLTFVFTGSIQLNSSIILFLLALL